MIKKKTGQRVTLDVSDLKLGKEDLVTTDNSTTGWPERLRVSVVSARTPMTVCGWEFSQHVMQAGLTLAGNAGPLAI